jgi:hypothetical protein
VTKRGKQPSFGGIKPDTSKRPRSSDPQIEGKPLAWRFSGCDRAGPFGWDALADSGKHKEVIDKLHEFEQRTWEQLVAARCHQIDVSALEKLARDRLIEIEKDDVDELMTFHIAGAERLWCIKEANIMRVLWWDPQHAVYKTEKDKADRIKRKRR